MDLQIFEQIQGFLSEFKRSGISLQKQEMTFMEVADIHRNEKVFSNILWFLFDTEAEHGMADLWIRSLLEAADNDGSLELSCRELIPSETSTEVITTNIERDYRIDIVVETPSAVIGIENKIDAFLGNPLPAYAGYLQKMAKESGGDKTAILLTLTKRNELDATSKYLDSCKEQGVVLRNVTYENFLSRVKEHFGEYLDAADSDWITFARDFMRTIDNQGEQNMKFDLELFQFIDRNIDDINQLKEMLEEVTSMTKEQGLSLQKKMLNDEDLLDMNIGKPAVFSPDKCYMHCSTYYNVPIIETNGGRAHPQISNDLTQMSIEYWVSNPRVKAKVKQALLEFGLTIPDDEYENHLVVKSLPIETDEDELVEELKPLVRAILPIIDRERL